MRRLVPLLGCALLAACAAPALKLYTLGTQPVASATVPLGSAPVVVSVARVGIQDDLDTEDIVLRDGNLLTRSHRGRWATRLSLGITDRLTARLAARYPASLVTDRPLGETPSDRLQVNIGRLDVTTAGTATLVADWRVVPKNPAARTLRSRASFSATGPVATDQDVVTLIGTLLDKLASVIDVPAAR